MSSPYRPGDIFPAMLQDNARGPSNAPSAIASDPVEKAAEIQTLQWNKESVKKLKQAGNSVRAGKVAKLTQAAKTAETKAYLLSRGFKVGSVVLKGLNVLFIGLSIRDSMKSYWDTMGQLE